MHRKNYLAITALALGCNIASAGDMGGGAVCTPDNMTIPCNKPSWSFEAQAVYLQPVYSNLENSFYSNEVFPSASTPYSFSTPKVSPDWGWGFFLQGAYSFKNSKDITVDWLRMHNTSSSTKTVSSYNQAGSLTTPASFSFAPQLDAVNVVLGQTFNFDTKSSARLYGGVEYARLINNIANQYQDGSLYTNQNSSFNGAGPKLGVDLFYEPHFLPSRIPLGKIYAKGAATVLVGSQGASWNGQGTGLLNITNTTRTTRAIPALEAKVGLEGTLYAKNDFRHLFYDINYGIYSYLGGAKTFLGQGGEWPNTVRSLYGQSVGSGGEGGISWQGVQFGLRYVTYV